jgi:hypothetical protein
MPEPALEFIHQIRGNCTNNVFVVGAYNLIMHKMTYDCTNIQNYPHQMVV